MGVVYLCRERYSLVKDVWLLCVSSVDSAEQRSVGHI